MPTENPIPSQYIPKSENTRQLAQYLSTESELYKQGVINYLPQRRELANLYGLSPNTVDTVVERLGISMRERRELSHVREVETYEKRLLVPADDTAWMFGVISGGGGGVVDYGVTLTSTNKKLIDRFSTVGEMLFQKSSVASRRLTRKSNRPTFAVAFFDTSLALAVGNFRRDSWPETVISKYPWILREEQFRWKFLEGFFEVSGNVFFKKTKNISRLAFHTSSITATDFLTHLLVQSGIDERSIFFITNKYSPTGIKGIRISRADDMKIIANNIESLDDFKEENLEKIRQLPLKLKRRPKNKHSQPLRSNDEVASEWHKLKKILGHSPSMTEIHKLFSERKTKFSTKIYRNRFGGDKRKYSVARQTLEVYQIQNQDNAENNILQSGTIFP